MLRFRLYKLPELVLTPRNHALEIIDIDEDFIGVRLRKPPKTTPTQDIILDGEHNCLQLVPLA